VLVGRLALGSIPATATTLVPLSKVDFQNPTTQHIITLGLGIVLLITAFVLVAGRRVLERYANAMSNVRGWKVLALTTGIGFVMGLLVSATSVGAGAIGVTVLLLLHPEMSAARVVGSDIAHAVPLTLIAGVGHWYLGSVNWSLLGFLLIGSFPVS
jgi:uncharacterized protein